MLALRVLDGLLDLHLRIGVFVDLRREQRHQVLPGLGERIRHEFGPLAFPLAPRARSRSSIVAGDATSFHPTGREYRGNSGIPRIPTPTRPGPHPTSARTRTPPLSLQCVRYIPCMARGSARRASVAGDVAARSLEPQRLIEERRSRERSRRTRVARHASTDGTRRGIATWPHRHGSVVVVVGRRVIAYLLIVNDDDEADAGRCRRRSCFRSPPTSAPLPRSPRPPPRSTPPCPSPAPPA